MQFRLEVRHSHGCVGGGWNMATGKAGTPSPSLAPAVRAELGLGIPGSDITCFAVVALGLERVVYRNVIG